MTDLESVPPGLVSWVDVATPDLDKAIAFYGELFGWDVERGPEDMGFYSIAQKNGRNVAGMMPIQESMPMPPMWSTYVATDDADGTAKLATDNGANLIIEPTDAGPFGRMVVGFDPTGAMFGAWQPYEQKGFGITDVAGTPCWHELTTRDHKKANEFYAAVFGWTYADVGDDTFAYTLAKVGDRTVGGTWPMPADAPAEVPSNWTTYFAVEDADATAALVKKLGGTIQREPWDTPHGRLAEVHDPWGAHFNLMVPAESPSS
jgi:predicted enzyme related to lactoylglutathione lyase